jgi:hypothetical protein
MLVRNADDTGEETCPCGQWIDHFRSHSRRAGKVCYAVDCQNSSDLVGAHVISARGGAGIVYIVPLCRSCNGRTDDFTVADEYLEIHARPLPGCVAR